MHISFCLFGSHKLKTFTKNYLTIATHLLKKGGYPDTKPTLVSIENTL